MKYVDDLLITAERTAVAELVDQIKSKIKIGRDTSTAEGALDFFGLTIHRENGKLIASGAKNLMALAVNPSAKDRLHELRSVCGKLNWMGLSTVPEASFLASYLLQKRIVAVNRRSARSRRGFERT